MIKYYKELEKPNNFYLPLIERTGKTMAFKSVKRTDLPSGFFDKYEYLLRTIKDIDFLIRTIDWKKVRERIDNKEYLDEQGHFDGQSYVADYETLSKLEEIKEDMPETDKILQNPAEIISDLIFYSDALSLVVYLCPEIEDKWRKISLLFDSALKDIENYSSIKYNVPNVVARNVELPNAWYITSYGDLYNTRGKRGHKESNLIYPYERIIRSFSENKPIEGNKDVLLKKRLEIINNGYIDEGDFMNYLKYIYDFPFIQTSDDNNFLDAKTYETRVVKIILGIISAQASLYSFFEDMQKYTFDPKRELYKLRDMTNNQMGDILVRCSGFYKIESSVNKTITTSSLTPFDTLYQYIIRGWNVCVINPIIISREEKIIKELDTTSPIVERYIEKDIKKYEKCKQEGYGKIY